MMGDEDPGQGGNPEKSTTGGKSRGQVIGKSRLQVVQGHL